MKHKHRLFTLPLGRVTLDVYYYPQSFSGEWEFGYSNLVGRNYWLSLGRLDLILRTVK